MQKINFENKPSTNSPINGTNLNLLQDNVEDAINNINFNISESAVKTDYSFENNPIFVKKINFGNLPNATIKDVNHYITNFSKIIKIEGTAVTSSGYGYSIPNNNMLVFFTSEYVRISTSSNESDYVAELLIYYVKKKKVIKIENIETFLLGLAAIIAAIGVLIKAIKSTKKEIDSLPKRIKKQVDLDDLIISKMEEVKEQLNADRVQVYDFHNGGHYANGRSALKTSCSYEVVRSGISRKQSFLQSIPLSCLSKFVSKLMNDGSIEVKNLEDMKEEMPATYQLKKDMKINSFYDVILNNSMGEPVGFLAVQFVKNKYNVLTEHDKDIILNLKELIEEQLEKVR